MRQHAALLHSGMSNVSTKCPDRINSCQDGAKDNVSLYGITTYHGGGKYIVSLTPSTRACHARTKNYPGARRHCGVLGSSHTVSGNIANLSKFGTYSTTYNGCSSHTVSGNIINLSKFGKYVITYNGVICNPPEG